MSFGPASSETLMQRLYRAHCDVTLMTDLKYSHLQGFKVTSHLAGHHQCNSKYGLNPSYDQVMGIFSWFHKHFKYQSFDIKTTSKPSSYLAWLLIAPIRLQLMVIECHGRKKGIQTKKLNGHKYHLQWEHYNDVIMSTMASPITSLVIVYPTVYSGTDQRKHQSPASLAFVRRIHQWPVNSPHKGPVTWKMFSFHDVIMGKYSSFSLYNLLTHEVLNKMSNTTY